ncbi:MAG: type III toxin-antitoxin system ToxN/AbiQ family toxin [Oscillospiraceae bacterium]
MDICFYYIKNDYIDFLKKYEREQIGHTCVPNLQYKNSDKFVFGAVMNINDMNYFVPVSSYNKKQEDVILIRDKKNKSNVLGSLRFAYMLPVPTSCLNKLDIKAVTNEYSKVHISKELAFCRRERDKIYKQAEKTYFRVTHRINEQLVKNSCNFKLLEQAYIEYCNANDLEEIKDALHNSEERLFVEKVSDISEWADEVLKRADERNISSDIQKKDNNAR